MAIGPLGGMAVRITGRLLKTQQGQAMVEYAYILLFVALAAVAAFTAFGFDVLELINSYLSSV